MNQIFPKTKDHLPNLFVCKLRAQQPLVWIRLQQVNFALKPDGVGYPDAGFHCYVNRKIYLYHGRANAIRPYEHWKCRGRWPKKDWNHNAL